MLGEVDMVGDRIEGRRIELGESGMSVLAMKTFLETINHSFPIKPSLVGNAPTMWEFGEVYGVGESL